MRRRVWILAVSLMAALFIADAILWEIAAKRLEAGFEAWADRMRTVGLTIAHGRTHSAGWPFAARLTIGELVIGADPARTPMFVWQASRITLSVALSDPRFLEIEVEGTQRLRLPGLPEVRIEADRFAAGTTLASNDESREFEVLLSNLRANPGGANGPAPGLAKAQGFAIAQARAHLGFEPLAGPGDKVIQFSIEASDIALPPVVHWPLGARLASLAAEGGVVGPLPPIQGLTPWAASWRDGGGSVEVQRLVLAWGPLNLAASATLALDDQLQPMGAGNSHVTGYGATLDALADSGVLTRSAVTAAKAVLSLLAGTPAEGETPDVDVPLTLQFRTLSMRQVPLLRLPEIDWPVQ